MALRDAELTQQGSPGWKAACPAHCTQESRLTMTWWARHRWMVGAPAGGQKDFAAWGLCAWPQVSCQRAAVPCTRWVHAWKHCRCMVVHLQVDATRQPAACGPFCTPFVVYSGAWLLEASATNGNPGHASLIRVPGQNRLTRRAANRGSGQ